PNFCFLLLALTVFAVWIGANVAQDRPHRLVVRLLGGFGLLFFAFSVFSPDDDLLQQELFRPAVQSENLLRHVIAAPGGPVGRFSFAALAAQKHPAPPPKAGATLVALQNVDLRTFRSTPVPIHSP